MKYFIYIIFLGLVGCIPCPTYKSMVIKDSIVFRHDTARVVVTGGLIKMTIRDTIFDTIYKEKSGLSLKIWRDKYRALMVECEKKDSIHRAPVVLHDRIKTIEKVAIEIKKEVPAWIWIIIGSLLSLIIIIIVKK